MSSTRNKLAVLLHGPGLQGGSAFTTEATASRIGVPSMSLAAAQAIPGTVLSATQAD